MRSARRMRVHSRGAPRTRGNNDVASSIQRRSAGHVVCEKDENGTLLNSARTTRDAIIEIDHSAMASAIAKAV